MKYENFFEAKDICNRLDELHATLNELNQWENVTINVTRPVDRIFFTTNNHDEIYGSDVLEFRERIKQRTKQEIERLEKQLKPL